MERTLRVDRVRSKGAAESTGGMEREGEKADPRTMVFVGNLDFEVHEDAVRELFEKLVEKERRATTAETAGSKPEDSDEKSGSSDEDIEGDSQGDDGSDDESEGELPQPSKSTQPGLSSASTTPPGRQWVKSARIIRDKDTQLGKGFAFVQFHDRASADEILALEPGTIKLAKRKLRIQRCKTLPGATLPKPKPKERPSATKPSHSPKLGKSHHASGAPIPRADPTLGDRLRSLPKDQRKAAKSSDADRVARRLAKKKARVLMERGTRKAAGRKESILGVRTGGGKDKGVNGGKGTRGRSDKAILKKNPEKFASKWGLGPGTALSARRYHHYCLLIPPPPAITGMCVAFWTLAHPEYALILVANRDEFISRPTLVAQWHNFGSDPHLDSLDVLSGRDVAAGGTWLGVNKKGDVAVLTNITELIGTFESSRGELASNFLKPAPAGDSSPDEPTPARLSRYLASVSTEQRRYAGFNLLVLSPSSRSDGTVEYQGAMVTNSGGGGDIIARPLTQVESFCGGVSNADDSARPPQEVGETNDWPKVLQGKSLFREIVGRNDWKEDGLVDRLCEMMSTQNPTPPTSRYELRTTITVPPVRVEPNAWSTSIAPERVPASQHAAPDLKSRRADYYCTRLTTVVLVRRDGKVDFVERDVWQKVEGEAEPVKADKTSQRRFCFQVQA
ncbi:hypothetical protein FRC06_008557 [Ceratobasidium sp. 370]|nr:hypothetical protein FRC06_008557 [Ceratobasidium sp. 370]